MYSEGQALNSYDKVNLIPNKKLKYDIHNLRKTRNNLGLVHGFGSISQPREYFEKIVLEYIGLSFNKSLKDLDYILNNNLSYRSLSQIY